MSFSEFTQTDYDWIRRDYEVLRASAEKRCANEKELAADTILSEYLAADSLTIKQLMTVGKAQVNLKEPLYFINDTTLNCYVQQRGRGIYTLYYVTDRGTRHYPHGRLRSIAAVISVYEGADSLVICRGNMLGAAYRAKKN